MKQENNIDVLQDLVARYNNGYHRSIKEAPANVTKEKRAQNMDDTLLK